MISRQATRPSKRQPKAFSRRLFFVWYVLALLLFITTLTHYAVTYHKGFTLADVLASPSLYEGMNLSVTGPYGGSGNSALRSSGLGNSGPSSSSLSSSGRQGDSGNSDYSFYVIYNKKPVRIDYQNYEIGYDQLYVPPRWGEVSLYGQVQADGSLQAWRVHNYDYNYLLYILSFFTGSGVLLFFFHEWKITRRGIVGVTEVVKHA
jgi:hypothetical protein